MRFGLASGGFRDELARGRVDDADGVGEFGADVQEPVGAEERLMRAKGFAEVDGGGEFSLLEIDDVDGRAVRSGLAHRGVAVDGTVGEARVRRDGDAVAGDRGGNFAEPEARREVDEEDG